MSDEVSQVRTTAQVVNEIKRMISTGEMLPGQQVRQEGMAGLLGVSRLPIREALRQLTADGLVRHTPNAGYTVTRLSRAEFDQIYRMRRILETDLLLDLPSPSGDQTDEIERLSDLVVQAAENKDLTAMQAANHDFHFAIFRISPLTLVVEEIERIWSWAAPYHASYLSSPENRRAILAEHELMVTAVQQGDGARLAKLMDLHRHGSESQVGANLIPFQAG